MSRHDTQMRRPQTRRIAGVVAAIAVAVAVSCPAVGSDRLSLISRVDVEGHRSLPASEIASVITGGADEVFDEARIESGVDSLLTIMATLGRPFASVSVSWEDDDGEVAVTVLVDEGPEVRLGTLAFRGGESAVQREVVERFDTRPGAPVRGPILEADIETLVEAYADSGLPFAEVRLPTFVVLDKSAGLSIGLEVTRGVPAFFGDLVVIGNEVTKAHVIARETGLVRGDPYSASKLDRVRPRLERLRFLSSVSEPVVAVDPRTGEATVGLEVVEGTPNRISGILGYAADGGEDEITGLVDVDLANLAGTGRSASASWERLRRGETRISFSYTEPWVLGSPVDIGVAGAQFVRDTLYTTTEADVFVSARMGARTRVTWSLGGERYVPGGVGESTTTGYRTALKAAFDGTDVPWNPTSGTTVEGRIEYAAKEAADTGRSDRSGTLTLMTAHFHRVRARQVLALRVTVAGLSSTERDVPFHELLVLGGARSLRGYREEQFRGTRTALGTAEYRFILTRRSRALAFVDLGYWYRGGSETAEGSALGYGIGLRGETRLGTIALDYGLGEGDGLLDGKLHVGIVREF